MGGWTFRQGQVEISVVASQGEVERRALINFTLSPDPATMALDNTCHGCEADSCSLEIGGRMEPPERGEEFVDVSHLESGAIVMQTIDRSFIGPGRVELDLRLRLLARELPSVLK